MDTDDHLLALEQRQLSDTDTLDLSVSTYTARS